MPTTFAAPGKALICLLFLLASVPSSVVAATPVANFDELLDATTGVGDDKVLNSGEYQIIGGSAIDFSPYSLAVRDGSTLTADNAGFTGVLLQVHGLAISGGTLTAAGGAGDDADGVRVDTFTLAGSYLTATGGGGNGAAGIAARTFDQNGGTVTARGGDADVATSSAGVEVDETYTLRSGALDAAGGDGDNARGVTAATFDQSGGAVTATGGGGADAYGMYAGSYSQIAGTLIARGGVGANDHGLAIGDRLDIDSALRLERQGDAASVELLSATAAMRLGSASELTPVVDLARIDAAPDAASASGLIRTAGGTVTIEAGARVTPFFTDARNLALNQPYQNVPFIAAGGGIDGEFADSGAGVERGYFISYSVTKADNKYVLQFEREREVVEEISGILCENSRTIIGTMDAVLARNPDISELVNAWDVLENSQDRADWVARASHVGRTMAPLAYMKYTHSLVRVADLVQTDFTRRVGAFSRRPDPAVWAASESAVSSLAAAPRDWTMWASPLFQQSSRFKAACPEFDDAKEKHYGFSVGAARRWGALTLGATAHYIRGDYDADYTDLDSDSVGLVLGGRLEAPTPAGGWFDPHLDFSFSYTRSEIDQKNLGYDHLWRKSSPHADTYRAGVWLGNRISLGRRLVITPGLGVDYTRVDQSGYRDRGDSGYLFAVSGAGYDSLRPGAGLDVEVRLTDRLTATAQGRYRYETMDRRSTFYTRSASFDGLGFAAVGENRNRASGTVGAGLRYAAGERVTASFSYDLLVEDKYTAHRFTAGVGIAF